MPSKVILAMLAVLSLFSCNLEGNNKGADSSMKIWAHRGCSYAWPENTLQAFEAACKYNITGIELDIQLTKDNKIVVIHDETLDRTTSGTGKVKDFTLSEIKNLKIATHPGFLGIKKYTQVPTIEEVFDLLKPYCLKKGLLINIELKTNKERYEGIEDMILALVKEYDLEKYIVYSSFNPDSVILIKQKKPDAKVGILKTSEQDCLTFSQEHPVDAIHPYVKKLDVENIRLKTTLPIRAWGADEPFYPNNGQYEILDLETLKKLGVTDIFTNVPEAYL